MEFIKKQTQQFNNADIDRLSSKFNIHKDVVRLLFARGYTTDDEINKFVNAGETQLYNPFMLKNMQEVVDKINYYINNNKHILIMGDYDTDGISAAAILYKYFEKQGISTDVFLPNRFVDGYGLTIDTINKVNNLYKPDLIITVDCGITCVDEIKYCKDIGIDIIVTDHHDIPSVTPDTLIINPKLPDQIYPFKELCGAGVALKLIQALGGITEALNYVAIATLATVADIVPLVDENRAIVKLGLEQQKEQLPKGIKMLCKYLKIPLPLSSTDISFKIAPKINATGRMGDAIISFRLYVENDDAILQKNLDELIALNDLRVTKTNEIFESACQMLEDTNVSRLGMIVLYKEDWESGVLGIICSKLVEKYNKPVCLLSLVDNEFKGSCRSIPGVNIFDALTSVSDILIRFGGHNQAGGLSIERKYLKEFRTRINDFVLNNTNEDEMVSRKYYDVDISDIDLTPEFVKDLQIFEPCGFKNEKPLFRVNITDNNATRMINHHQHLRIKQNNISLIGFGKGDYYYNLNVNCNKEVIAELAFEKGDNKQKVSGFIRHVNYSKLNTATKSEIISANYLTQLKYINCRNDYDNSKVISYTEALSRINKMTTKSRFGTAIIVNNMDTYFDVVKAIPNVTNYELFDINNACGENVIIFAPHSDVSYKDYQNIFVMDSYLCQGYISSLCTKFNHVYCVDNKINIGLFNNLDVSRNTFAKIHNSIKSKLVTNPAPDLITYFNYLRRTNHFDKNIKYNQFVFFMLTMEELGILKFEDGTIVETDIKSKLENSSIYYFIKKFLNL
ncbi:MAG: single-stranded-DNA-specific exonuclease RecJ [Clostridiales bacterium]|nr:single-stranded-DNA-specific exonuclease RecJ [Clostridiales bacterium]